MAVDQPPITIVGCGPGAIDYITPAAMRCIREADVLVGAGRLLDLFPDCRAERIPVSVDIEDILSRIEARRHTSRVAVLVTGDPGICSLAQPVLRRFGLPACRVVPGISSIQVAFARLGLDWLDARLINAHGGDPDVSASELEAVDKIAVLAGRLESMQWIARLASRLSAERRIVVLEDLTLDTERIREVSAQQLAEIDASSRTIVLLIKEESV